MYEIQKNITKLNNGQPTFFLDPSEQNLIKKKIGNTRYKVFSPNQDSEKVIFYINEEPQVVLYQIQCRQELRHQDILGTMYSLNISRQMYGDIILDNGHYYIYILKLFQNYFEMYFLKVKNTRVELKQLDLNYLDEYKRKFIEMELIVSSERIDTVLAHVANTSRSIIKEKVCDKQVLLNCEVLKNLSYTLRKDDTFSIRKIGKFKYMGIIKMTKRNNLIVKVLKYI